MHQIPVNPIARSDVSAERHHSDSHASLLILLAWLWAGAAFATLAVQPEQLNPATTPAQASDAVPVKTTKVTDVWVVFKTHFDIGYTDLITNVLHRYRVEMMDKALAVMETNRSLPAAERFSWPAGQPKSLRHCLADERPQESATGSILVQPHGLVTLRLEW